MLPSLRSTVLLPTLTTLVSVLVSVAAPTTVAAPVVKPLALSIGAAAVAEMPFEFRPSANTGTAVTLWVDGFDAAIVKLDADRSRIATAADAAGNDLLAEPEGADNGFGHSVLDTFPRIRDDRGAMMLDVNLPGLAAGGGPVAITGELMVVVATGTSAVTTEAVAAGRGSVVVGAHTLEIKSIGPSDWNPEQQELTLTMSAAFADSVKTWIIRDADGAVLTENGPQSTTTMNNRAELGFPLAAKTAQLRFELEIYEGLKSVAVPLDLAVGLGLE